MEPIEGKKATPAAALNAATPRHRELYRLLLAGVDIDEALEMATLAQERASTGELQGPLLEAAAVAYARVFSDVPVMGPLPERALDHSDEKIQWLHHQLLSLREKSVSHDALAKHPVVVHLYEANAALELVSSDLKSEHVPQILAHLKTLRGRLAMEVVTLVKDLFPDRRAAFHLLVAADSFPKA